MMAFLRELAGLAGLYLEGRRAAKAVKARRVRADIRRQQQGEWDYKQQIRALDAARAEDARRRR